MNVELALDEKTLAILQVISRRDTFTKMDVVRATHLSLPTVNNTLAALQEARFIIPLGSVRSANGRPPIRYRFNPAVRHVVGVEIQVPQMAIGLLDLHANVIGMSEYPFTESATSKYVLETLESGIRQLASHHQVNLHQIVGIGLGVPGFVERDTGIWLSYLRFPRVRDVPLRSFLTQNFGVPVFIQNEINVYAVAELHRSQAGIENDALIITCSGGLKASVLADGRILSGDHGNFGLVGHLIVVENGIPCFCGARGCLEMYASSHAFRRELAARGYPIPDLADLDDVSLAERVFRLAAEGEPVCRQLVEQVIPYMAYAFATLVRLTNIDRVVLLGAYSEGGDYLRDLLYDQITRQLPEVARSRLSIRMGHKLKTGDLVAAAALPAIQAYLGIESTIA